MSALYAVWFLLPAGCANMAPVFAAKLFPQWDTPLDGHRMFRGKRLLGDHKTIRGLVSGILVAYLTFLGQQWLWKQNPYLQTLIAIDYGHLSSVIGIVMGTGALLGDAAKSVIKRQFDIAPGKPWIPFDQLDWLLGAILVTAPFIVLPWSLILLSLLIGFFLHIVIRWIGFLLHLAQTPV